MISRNILEASHLVPERPADFQRSARMSSGSPAFESGDGESDRAAELNKSTADLDSHTVRQLTHEQLVSNPLYLKLYTEQAANKARCFQY